MKKIFYFVIGFLSIISISYYFYYSPKKEEITKEIYLEKSIQMRKHLTDEIKRKQDNTLNMAFILSQDLLEKASSILSIKFVVAIKIPSKFSNSSSKIFCIVLFI